MSGGFIAGLQSPAVSFSADSAVTYAGLLLKKNATSGEIALCGHGERPDGYAIKSTENLAGTAVADVQVGMLPLIPGNVVEMVLAADNAEITLGENISP
jgi:O-succinylbenzoate synthase